VALHPDFLAIMGKPAEADIEIVQGDGGARLCTLRKRNTDGSYTPYDITGWTFRLQVRADYDAASTVLIAATIAPTANAAQGEYSEAWDPAQTAALAATVAADQPLAPLGVYDLDVSSGGETVTLKRGRVTLKRQVSRT
jgi:hypothetical protein